MAVRDLMFMSRPQLEDACIAFHEKVADLEARIAADASHRERLEAALSALLPSIDNLRGYRVNERPYLAHVDVIYRRVAALARGETDG